jgi:hypothetical protein
MHRLADDPVDKPFLAEAHLRLRRMDVHVDLVRGYRDVYEPHGVPADRQQSRVRFFDCVRQRP